MSKTIGAGGVGADLAPYVSDIIFDKETHFIGRNGVGRCKGIQVRRDTFGRHVVAIEPLTSKLVCGNCQIVVDGEAVPELIRVLKIITQHIKKKGSR